MTISRIFRPYHLRIAASQHHVTAQVLHLRSPFQEGEVLAEASTKSVHAELLQAARMGSASIHTPGSPAQTGSASQSQQRASGAGSSSSSPTSIKLSSQQLDLSKASGSVMPFGAAGISPRSVEAYAVAGARLAKEAKSKGIASVGIRVCSVPAYKEARVQAFINAFQKAGVRVAQEIW